MPRLEQLDTEELLMLRYLRCAASPSVRTLALAVSLVSLSAPAPSEIKIAWFGSPPAKKLAAADRKSPARFDDTGDFKRALVITYTVNITPEALRLLTTEYNNIWLGFHWKVDSDGVPAPGAFESSVVHTAYWLPYLYYELQERMPNTPIIIQPM